MSRAARRDASGGALGVVAALGVLFAARTASAACLGRPTDAAGFRGYSYDAAEVTSYAGTKVRVHYAKSGPHAPTLTSTREDGVPDTVAYAADTGDTALEKYEAMGYHPIPSDEACASNGGDGKVDIYLVHFTAADGSTFAECNGASCSSFALVESKFSGAGYASPEEGFRTVVTHELFHAVQNTYKPEDAPFWAEGSAQWAMKKVHPELPDFERQMPGFFSESTRSIDSPPGGVTSSFLYGSAVWPLFLSLRQGDDFIRAVFEGEAADGKEPLAAIDAALQARGTSLAAEYPLFAAWNVGTGKLKSTGGYPDAAKYPGVTVAKLAAGTNDITSGFGYFAYRGTLTTEQQISLDTDPSRNAGVVVPVVGGVLQLDEAKKLPANANGEIVVVVSGITTKKSDAPFRIQFSDPAPETETPDGGAATPTSAPPAAAAPPDDGGCRTAPGAPLAPGSALVALLALAALRRRA